MRETVSDAKASGGGNAIDAAHAGDVAGSANTSPHSRRMALRWECTAFDGWIGLISGVAHFAARSVLVVVVGAALFAALGLTVGLLAGAGAPPTGAIAAQGTHEVVQTAEVLETRGETWGEARGETQGATSAVVDTQTITTTAQLAATNAHASFLARFVEWFIACALLLVGLSLLLRARAWMSAFSSAISHPLTPLLSGLYALLMGLFIVLAHNLWVRDARVLVTIVGWISLVFGAFFLLVPEAYGAMLRRMPITPQFVALRGLLRIGLGGAIATYLLTQG